MIYRDFQDLKLSGLGMGCMRLPVIGGDDNVIDEAAAEAMVDYAMAHGVNYYDTAWGYHGGNSEVVLGKCLKKYPRGSFYLADKFPGYSLSNMGKTEEIFNEQLKKAGVDYFDFYLVHNVCEMNIEEYLDDEKYGTVTHLLKEKAAGRIRHLGFSEHGDLDVMERFLDAYGEHMEFCQIQLNWVDWDFQNAKKKVEMLRERSIPVWVMEPLRGGKLASLSKENEEKLRALRPDEKIPAWALRFVQSIPEVVVTLSGASSLEQMAENVRTFETDKPLNETELKALSDIAGSMIDAVPCTACRYCVSHCPQGLDIPKLLSYYNEHVFTGGGFIVPMALMAVPNDKHPDACVGCRSCEEVCPQGIKISEVMADFTEKLK